MADPVQTPVAPEVPPTIVTTPEPAAPPTPEQILYKEPAKPDVVKPVATPEVKSDAQAPVTPEVKPPTEAAKEPAKPAADSAPKEYELKLPDNSKLTSEDLAAIAKEAKEAGLTKEEADELLKSHDATATKTAQRLETQRENLVKTEQAKWVDQIKNDPVIGGDRYNETVALASRAFKATASPELQKLVQTTGLGNHPEYVRQMAMIGRMMAEDKLVTGSLSPDAVKKSPEEVLFGRTTPGANGRTSGE